MGKKYIIELEDKPFHKGNGDFLYRVKGFNSLVFDMTGVGKLTPYTEPDLEQVRKEAYEKGWKEAEDHYEKGYNDGYDTGLSDAWEAARKICLADYDGGIQPLVVNDIFNVSYYRNAMKDYSASEAIEKIRQYEQRQEEIQVGDLVELKCGVSPAIYVQGTDGSDEIYLLFNDGSCGVHNRREIECKTGRHFPEIAEVLQKMKEQTG